MPQPKPPPELQVAPGRPPPCDLDAEAVVISDVVLKPDNYDVVAGILVPEDFYSRSNRAIWEAIVDLRTAQIAVDIRLIAGWLRDRGRLEEAGGMVYLARVIDATPAVVNVLDHANRVKDKSRLRAFIATGQVLIAEAYTGGESTTDLLIRAETAIGAIAHETADRKLDQVGRVMGLYVDDLAGQRERGEEVSGIQTGFYDLDRRTGGLYEGDLIIVAARPGMGKSAFVSSILTNVTRPRRDAPSVGCAFFSLEMPRQQIAGRVACAEYDIAFTDLRTGKLDDSQFQKLQDAALGLRQYPLWVDDTPAISVPQIRARVRKLQRDVELGRGDVECAGVRVVVVDYLQLATGEKGQGREYEVSSLSRNLKQVAKDLGVCVIAVSQLNRAVETRKDKRPALSDLRESGAIEQDADAVWFVYREGYYFPETDPSLADVDVAKQRNGPTGRCDLYFNGRFMRFSNYTAEQEEYYDVGEDP